MHPILFRIGPVNLFTYGLAIALAFLVASILVFHEAEREGIETGKLFDFGLIIIISGIIGARVLYILMNPSEYFNDPIKILKVWEGGLVFYGGIIVAMIAGIFLLKRYKLPLWRMMDILAPPVVLAQAIGRLGCFMAGCCFGRSTNLPWAVRFNNIHSLAPVGVPLHPTQLYHFLVNLLIFLILIYILRKKRQFSGQVFSLYLCLYPLGRFIIEFFRGDCPVYIIGVLNLAQLISIFIFLIGVYIYLWRNISEKASNIITS